MSQEKVERNKELKANRKNLNRTKRMKTTLAGIITALVCIVIVAWIGFSIYTKSAEKAAENVSKVPVNITSITDFIDEVQTN